MDKNTNPHISVVLPVYNGMAFLQESVESVLSQDIDGFTFEFLICDDCSTDESYDYLKSLNHPSITLLQNESNKGLFPTLNRLIKSTSADLVHLWAQDDVMLSNCLKETIKFHKQFPNVNFSFSRLQTIDNEGNYLRHPETFDNKTLSVQDHAISSLLYGSIAGNIANVCLVKKAVEEVGYFDDSMIYVGDFKMWCLLSRDLPIGMNGQILVNVRQHKGQLSRNLDASYHKMRENYEVYQCFLSTLEPELKPVLLRALKWKIYPTYFNQYVYILSQKRLDLAKRYKKHLKQYDSMPGLFFRWALIRFMKVLKLEHKFYTWRFYNTIRKMRSTNTKTN